MGWLLRVTQHFFSWPYSDVENCQKNIVWCHQVEFLNEKSEKTPNLTKIGCIPHFFLIIIIIIFGDGSVAEGNTTFLFFLALL